MSCRIALTVVKKWRGIVTMPYQPTNQQFIFRNKVTEIAMTIENNSGRLPEKPYGSMNWSPI